MAGLRPPLASPGASGITTGVVTPVSEKATPVLRADVASGFLLESWCTQTSMPTCPHQPPGCKAGPQVWTRQGRQVPRRRLGALRGPGAGQAPGSPLVTRRPEQTRGTRGLQERRVCSCGNPLPRLPLRPQSHQTQACHLNPELQMPVHTTPPPPWLQECPPLGLPALGALRPLSPECEVIWAGSTAALRPGPDGTQAPPSRAALSLDRWPASPGVRSPPL